LALWKGYVPRCKLSRPLVAEYFGYYFRIPPSQLQYTVSMLFPSVHTPLLSAVSYSHPAVTDV